MATFILALSILAAEPAKSDAAFHEYDREISALFKQESHAKSTGNRATAVRALCDLHERLVHDSRYATSDVLKEYRNRIWSRLTKIKGELQRQIARDHDANRHFEDAQTLSVADSQQAEAAFSLSDSLSLLDMLQGGPGRWIAMGGGPVAPDWGPDLVALIERTINPAFWDVVGGPGTIVYYQPLQCLVVRATSEVHNQIGGAVGDLRRAAK